MLPVTDKWCVSGCAKWLSGWSLGGDIGSLLMRTVLGDGEDGGGELLTPRCGKPLNYKHKISYI